MGVMAASSLTTRAGSAFQTADSAFQWLVTSLKSFWKNGVALISLASFIFSVSALCVKELTIRGQVPTFQVLATVALACSLGASTILYLKGDALLPNERRHKPLAVLRGLLGAGALMLFYLAMEKLALKDAVTLFFTSPIWCAIMERIFLPHDSPSIASILSCLLAIAGILLVSQPDCLQHSSVHAAGIALGLGAAVMNAVAYIMMRALGKNIVPVALTWWFHASTLMISAVPLLARAPPAVLPAWNDWALLMAVAALQFNAQILLSRGFQLVTATHGAALNTLQVLFACFWDAIILHAAPNMLGLLGALLVVLGVLGVTILNTETPRWLRDIMPAWQYTAVPSQESPSTVQASPGAASEVSMTSLFAGGHTQTDSQQLSQHLLPNGTVEASSCSGVDVHEPGPGGQPYQFIHRRHSCESAQSVLGVTLLPSLCVHVGLGNGDGGSTAGSQGKGHSNSKKFDGDSNL